MTQINYPIISYEPAVFSNFMGFVSNGENYKYPRQYLVKARNYEITKQYKLKKARGYSTLGTGTWNSNRIWEIFNYKNDSDNVFLCFGTNSAGTSGAVAKVSSPWSGTLTFSEIKSLSNITTKPIFIQFDKLAYFFNGTEDQFYDGTSWGDIGASAPTNGATLNTTIAGSLNTSSDYIVAWRWADSTNNRRSDISPLSNKMTTGATSANGGLRITLPGETAPTGYDKIEILCTLAFGTQLFVDQTIDSSDTTADITTSDYVRSQKALYEGYVNAAPTRKYDIAAKIGNKIFAGRQDDSSCQIDYTFESTEYGPQPQSWPAKYFVICDSNSSDKLRGIGYVGSQENPTPIVFKQRSFGKLVDVGNNRFIYQKIADIDCDSPHAIGNIEELCVWKGKSNIYATDGRTFYKLGGAENGEGISETVSGLNASENLKSFICVVDDDRQVRVGCVRSGQSWPDYFLYGHYNDYKNSGIMKWTTREPGSDTSTYPGVRALCMKSFLDTSGETRVVFGNSNANGQIYEMDVGTSDNGSSIYDVVEFRPETFEDYKNEKIFTDVKVRLRTGSTSTAVTFYTIRDLSGVYETQYTETFSGSGFIFGTSSRLGLDSFGGETIFDPIIPCQTRALSLGFALSQGGTATLEILDVIMTGMP